MPSEGEGGEDEENPVSPVGVTAGVLEDGGGIGAGGDVGGFTFRKICFAGVCEVVCCGEDGCLALLDVKVAGLFWCVELGFSLIGAGDDFITRKGLNF